MKTEFFFTVHFRQRTGWSVGQFHCGNWPGQASRMHLDNVSDRNSEQTLPGFGHRKNPYSGVEGVHETRDSRSR